MLHGSEHHKHADLFREFKDLNLKTFFELSCQDNNEKL